MRAFLFVSVFLLFSTKIQAQTPDYFENSPTWYVSVVGGVPGMGNGYYEWSYLYYLNGDSTINGNTYRQIWARGYDTNNGTTMPGYFNGFSMLLRQEGKSFRFFESQSQTDSLMIDYDVSVGDTMKGHVFKNAFMNEKVVQKIDSAFIGTSYRKRVFMDSVWAGHVIIEGVADGSNIDTNGLSGMYGASVFRFLDNLSIEHLPSVCYSQNGYGLWPYEGGTCNANLGVDENDIEAGRVYVDHEKHVIKFIDPNSIGQYTIFNSVGQKVVTSSEGQLSTHGWSPGLYIIIGDSDSWVERIVIQ